MGDALKQAGLDLLEKCTSQDTKGDCSSLWNSLFFSLRDCENAQAAVDVMLGKTKDTNAACLWMNIDEIVDDDKRWVLNSGGQARLSIDNNA